MAVAPGMMIAIDSGEKRAEQVKIGDKIKSVIHGKFRPKEVTFTEQRKLSEKVTLSTEHTTVTVSMGQLVVIGRDWARRAAGDIDAGDVIKVVYDGIPALEVVETTFYDHDSRLFMLHEINVLGGSFIANGVVLV